MTRSLELVVKLATPKSPKMNTLNNGAFSNDFLERNEILSELDLSNTKYRLGMLVIKAKYFDNVPNNIVELLEHINKKFLSIGVAASKVASIIVINMLTRTPIPSQYKKIESLYKKFGPKAELALKKQIEIKNQLDELYEDSYQREQLKSILKYEKLKLDQLAREKAKSTTLCPKCQGASCDLCTSGHIRITMDDALQLFHMFKIPLCVNSFSITYWEPILSIFRELRCMEKEAVHQMGLKHKKINKTKANYCLLDS
ncbi:hypothetical protein [Psychromonas sp. SR45-3]|uniref:hypothetical protein n=1 Tax=Psychromonas sp. SR45-3 TaxID=2760930 RepID=UPI0015FD7B45|nr:hypothetical protein [Psychromonas sp. SR45-3]MBB1272514.1 hypothetical protein [Psychromonas sp. SR45-3]